jgi:hypothetical protein
MNTKNIIQILPFFITFLFYNCGDKQREMTRQISKPPFEKKVSLISDSLKIDIPIEVWGWKLNKDQIIILSERDRESFLYTLSLPDFKLVYKYGQYGGGPGEFIAANWLNTTKEDQLGLYDIPRWKMFVYDLMPDTLSLNTTFGFKVWEGVLDGRLCRPYTSIQQINDSIFLLKADMTKFTEIEVVNIRTDSILQTFRNLIKRKPTEAQATYFFEMAANEKNVILSYHCVDRLEFFQYNDGHVSPYLIMGSNKDQSDNKNYDEYIYYYTQVLCDNKYVYALYQGQKEGEIHNSHIEIYTLDGEPVMQIELGKYIYMIALDRKRNLIYGYSPDDSFDYVHIYSFNLNQI